MSATFVRSLLHERLGELLAALDACARPKGYFSMIDVRAVADALDASRTARITQAQAVTIVRYLRGKGKWRGIGPNPVYAGKARPRHKSEYRILPAGHSLIAETGPGTTAPATQPRQRERQLQVLDAFRAAHPDGGSMSDLISSVAAAAPGAMPMRIRRLVDVAIRQGLLLNEGQDHYVVTPTVPRPKKHQPHRALMRTMIWAPIALAIPEHIRDSDRGFTVQDLYAASWRFGDFTLDEAKHALRELVKAHYVTPAARRGHYIPESRILDLADNGAGESQGLGHYAPGSDYTPRLIRGTIIHYGIDKGLAVPDPMAPPRCDCFTSPVLPSGSPKLISH